MARADLAILGAGSWGTALALHLSRSGRSVALWVHDGELAERLRSDRVNARYLPDHTLPQSVRVTHDIAEAVEGASDILLVVPSHYCRQVLVACRPLIKNPASLCVAAKGIESDTLMTVSEVVLDVLGPEAAQRTAVLSGPSFAQEVARGHPTAVVVASRIPDLAGRLQRVVSSGSLRAYTNTDLVGVELGGALKNVIAIGAGAVDGLGYGANTRAALITRGLAEISRLAEALGGRRETLAGLAGLGDLVLTCTGDLSRNRRVGLELARGRGLEEILGGTSEVAEGVRTARAACALGERHGVEMPISETVEALLAGRVRPDQGVERLMSRQLRSEQE